MKRVSAVMLCLLLIASVILPVFAEEGSYVIQDGSVYVAGAGGTVASVTVNGQNVAFSSTTVEETGLHVTYIVAIDCSTGLSQVQKDQQSKALEGINQSMRPDDDMVLVYLTNKLVVGERLTSKEERAEAIRAERPHSNGTYLYDSIVKLAKLVEDTRTYPGINSIIVISSGSDLNAGATEKDATNAMRNCSASINTVALLDQFPDQYSKSRAVALKDMAAASNGAGVCMSVDTESGREAAAIVMKTVLQTPVVQLNAADLDRSGENVEIRVTCSVGSKNVDGYAVIPTSQLPAAQAVMAPVEPIVTEAAAEPAPVVDIPVETVPDTVPETVPETIPETTAAPVQETVAQPEPETTPAPVLPENVPVRKPDASVKKGGDMVFYLLIAGGLISLLAALVVVVLMLRRREEEEGTGLLPPDDVEFMETKSARSFEKEMDPFRIEGLDFTPTRNTETRRKSAPAVQEPIRPIIMDSVEPVVPAAKPAPAERPAPAKKPDLFAMPDLDVKPVPAAKPAPVEQPAPAKKPDLFAMPDLDVKPVPAAKPAPVEQPAPAKKPDLFAVPDLDVKPVPTAKPAPAEQPIPVKEPVPVEKPAPVAAPAAPVAAPAEQPAATTVSVQIASAEDQSVALKFSLAPNSSVTIGRNQRSDMILNAQDTALSGLHFEMRWDGSILSLCDRNSTNGTILNRTHLQPDAWTRVENGDILRVGSRSYSISCNNKLAI